MSACGARSLNLSTCKRDSRSHSRFKIPGMCLDLKRMLFLRQFNTSLRTKTMTFGSREVCLLIISTTALLSEKKTMQ